MSSIMPWIPNVLSFKLPGAALAHRSRGHALLTPVEYVPQHSSWHFLTISLFRHAFLFCLIHYVAGVGKQSLSESTALEIGFRISLPGIWFRGFFFLITVTFANVRVGGGAGIDA